MELLFVIGILAFIALLQGIEAFLMATFLAIFLGLAIFVGQIGAFLYFGEWSALSGLDIVSNFLSFFYSPPDYPWIFAPESWRGVHAVLAWAPASLALVGFGFLLFFIGMIVALVFDR